MKGRAQWAVVVIALLAAAGTVVAQASKTPVESTITDSELIYLGEGFIDDDGILHVRGQLLKETVVGDLEGYLDVDADFDVDLATWTGDMRGKLRFVATWGDLEGTFEGRFSGTWDHGYFDGHWELKGTAGDFVGMQLKVDNYGPGTGPQVVKGIVLDPHGD